MWVIVKHSTENENEVMLVPTPQPRVKKSYKKYFVLAILSVAKILARI